MHTNAWSSSRGSPLRALMIRSGNFLRHIGVSEWVGGFCHDPLFLFLFFPAFSFLSLFSFLCFFRYLFQTKLSDDIMVKATDRSWGGVFLVCTPYYALMWREYLRAVNGVNGYLLALHCIGGQLQKDAAGAFLPAVRPGHGAGWLRGVSELWPDLGLLCIDTCISALP